MENEKIIVYSTDKDKFHATGSPIECATQAMADQLIKNGMATATKGATAGRGKSAEDTADNKNR